MNKNILSAQKQYRKPGGSSLNQIEKAYKHPNTDETKKVGFYLPTWRIDNFPYSQWIVNNKYTYHW